jgi:hypothetical protein
LPCDIGSSNEAAVARHGSFALRLRLSRFPARELARS